MTGPEVTLKILPLFNASIVYPFPSIVNDLETNIVNTAISRAKKTVHLVYLGDALKMAAANTYKSDRETRLVSMLKNFEKAEEKEDENSVSLEEIIEEERKNNEKKE